MIRSRDYSGGGRKKQMRKIIELQNHAARSKMSDLVSDRAGRSFDSFGEGRHALSERVNTREQESLRFANEVVSRVTGALQQGKIDDYAIIAAPRFLGNLRNAINRRVPEPPALTISKDVVGHDVEKIRKLLSPKH